MKRGVSIVMILSVLAITGQSSPAGKADEPATAASSSDMEPHGLKSYVAKKLLGAVAAALRSHRADALCRALAGVGGKRIANAIYQCRLIVADTLEGVAKWTGRVTREMVKDQLTSALRQAGLPADLAREIGFYVAIAIEWTLL